MAPFRGVRAEDERGGMEPTSVLDFLGDPAQTVIARSKATKQSMPPLRRYGLLASLSCTNASRLLHAMTGEKIPTSRSASAWSCLHVRRSRLLGVRGRDIHPHHFPDMAVGILEA